MSNDLCEDKVNVNLRACRQIEQLADTLENIALKKDVTIRPNDYHADILLESGGGSVDYGILQAVADDLTDMGENDMARRLIDAHEEARTQPSLFEKNMVANRELHLVSAELRKKGLYAFCDCVKIADAR